MLILVILFKSPLGKGIIGEFVLKTLMGKNRPKKDTFVIHQLKFYDGTKSLEIPHVVINCSGIHIIETFNEIGAIHGDEKDKTWLRKNVFNSNEVVINNPIKHMLSTVKSLKQVIPYQAPIYMYIVFTGRAKIKVKSENISVLYPLSLILKIKKTMKKQSLLKPMDVRKVYEGLKNLRLINQPGHREEQIPFNHSKVYQKNR